MHGLLAPVRPRKVELDLVDAGSGLKIGSCLILWVVSVPHTPTVPDATVLSNFLLTSERL